MQKPQIAAELLAANPRRRGRPRAFGTISAARTAHVIVDLQNGFVERGAPVEVPAARLIMPNVNRIIREVRRSGGLNIFLRFTHDPGESMPWTIPGALGVSSFERRSPEARTIGNCPLISMWARMNSFSTRPGTAPSFQGHASCNPCSGHMIPMEQPAALARLVRSFLRAAKIAPQAGPTCSSRGFDT